MMDFWQILCDPSIQFLRNAVIAGLLGSIAFGTVGTLVVTRNLVSIGGAVAHAALAGIGFGCYAQQVWNWQWCTPLLGATAAAMLAALLVGAASLYASQREDTIIGSIWGIGMAVGLLFLNATPGYVDLQSYLFGNILLISTENLFWLVILDLAVLGCFILFYRWILAVLFDHDYAELRGIRSNAVYLLLLQMVALTVVFLVNIVGVFLVIALLALPAAGAGEFTRRLSRMMVLAVLICGALSMSGIWVSYQYEWPTGPIIVVFSGLLYLGIVCVKRWLIAPCRAECKESSSDYPSESRN